MGIYNLNFFIDIEDNFFCVFLVFWFWFWVFCFIDDDECVSDFCLNGGFCLDDINDYFCVCVLGWNGKDCENGEFLVVLEILLFIYLSFCLFEKYGLCVL